MVQLAEFQAPQPVARSQRLCHKKWCHLQVLPPPWSPNPHPVTNKSSVSFRNSSVQFLLSCINSVLTMLFIYGGSDNVYCSVEKNTWWGIKANCFLSPGCKLESPGELLQHGQCRGCPPVRGAEAALLSLPRVMASTAAGRFRVVGSCRLWPLAGASTRRNSW